MKYVAPWWLPGGNLQTIWAALRARRYAQSQPVFRRERWATPVTPVSGPGLDNDAHADFVDVDWLNSPPPPAGGLAQPLLVVFHGLEGSSASHYAEAFAGVAQRRGWACAVPHFRGCSGEINAAPRAYHSGDFAEIDWMLKRFAAGHAGPVLAVGISLGGNALMRWAGVVGREASGVVAAIASVCSPLDLAASGHAIGKGFNRLVYTRMFMRSLVPKALKKWHQHPGLFDRAQLAAARTIYDFDNVFTAPLHGFKGTDDYWRQASAKPVLHQIAIPALALNARNDPFIPAASLPQPGEVGRCVTLWQPAEGGHVGFPAGRFPGHVHAMPEAVVGFLAAHIPGV